MTRNRNPRYLKQYRDPAGNWINQYRRNGELIRLPNGRDFNDAFWAAYYHAEACVLRAEPRPIGETRAKPNSIDAALVSFYRSTTFLNLASSSQRAFRQSLERDFRPIVGVAPLAHLRPKHIITLISEKADKTPTGARLLLSAIRSFARHCVAVELIERDPSIGIKGPEIGSDGFATWTEDQIRRFEDHHPIGGLARLAEGLHVFTAQRTSDVIRMGWQHVRDGVIRLTQQKTGMAVAIPIHPKLKPILDALPRTADLSFLYAATGKRFGQSFYNAQWRKWCAEAGLPKECKPHGLRKAAARRLAEAGCNVHEIAAITGHRTLSEIQRYTEKVDRERLARQAIAAITTKTGTKVSRGRDNARQNTL
jgi:integrase